MTVRGGEGVYGGLWRVHFAASPCRGSDLLFVEEILQSAVSGVFIGRY